MKTNFKKTIFIILAVVSILLIGCSDEPIAPVPVAAVGCTSDFFSLETSNISGPSSFDLNKYRKSTVLGLSTLISTNPITGITGFVYNYTSTYNTTLNEVSCLINNKKLLKCNTITGITTSTTLSNVNAPVYVGTALRFLKYGTTTTLINPVNSQNYIASVNLQIVDEVGSPISTVQNVSFSTQSVLGVETMSSAVIGTKIFYLANCEIIIYDTVTAMFSVKKIDNYDYDTNRKFYQGLEVKNSTTLVALKQTVLPAYKIEVNEINVSSLSAATLPNTTIFNMTQSMLPASAPALVFIINALNYRSTTYDPCDDSYYFTYTNPTTLPTSAIYELKLNLAAVIVYPNVNKLIFSLEKGL